MKGEQGKPLKGCEVVLSSQLHVADVFSPLSYRDKGLEEHSVIALPGQNQLCIYGIVVGITGGVLLVMLGRVSLFSLVPYFTRVLAGRQHAIS